jgi:hypothetical protein
VDSRLDRELGPSSRPLTHRAKTRQPRGKSFADCLDTHENKSCTISTDEVKRSTKGAMVVVPSSTAHFRTGDSESEPLPERHRFFPSGRPRLSVVKRALACNDLAGAGGKYE